MSKELVIKFDKLEGRFDKLEAKLDMVIDEFNNHMEVTANNHKTILNNFQTLNYKIDALHRSTEKGFEDVKLGLLKIQSTTSYKEMYANMKLLKGDEDPK